MLNFVDGTRVAINGLDETLASLYSEGRPTDQDTAGEIIIRLEAFKNYISSSDTVRREYTYALLKEYREYVKRIEQKDNQDAL